MAGSTGPQSGLVASRRRWVTIARCWLKWQNVADVQVRESEIRKLSRSWCEHHTLALESSYFSIISTAIPVVVLESCEICFDSVCMNMFGLAQRVHIPSLRTVQHAALAHLAATARSRLDSREGYRQLRRVLLENFELNSDSMAEDMQVLMRKDVQQLSCFDSCWGWSALAESTVVRVSQNLPKLSYKQVCRDMELILMSESANHTLSLIELHEHLNSSHFLRSFGTIENPTLVSAILIDGVVGCGGGTGDAERVPQQFRGKEGFLDRCGEREQIFMLACVMQWAAWQCGDRPC